MEVLQHVPDHRSRRGRSYPLPAVLALLVLGMLLGRRSLSAIARLVPDYGGDLALLLGFPRRRTPSVAGLSRILQRLDVAAFERLLGVWIAAHPDLAPEPNADPAGRRPSGGSACNGPESQAPHRGKPLERETFAS
jgi:hypothetical protein